MHKMAKQDVMQFHPEWLKYKSMCFKHPKKIPLYNTSFPN